MEVSAAAAPSDLERKVAPNELFFSTTDRQGIIRSENSVFVRISRYSVEELTGAPHSITRHPDMPRGAFQLLWDRLLAGRPMGAYVKNLAKDGCFYWVFTTITPLGDGFLSVRMAPRSVLFDAARQLYPQTLAFEHELEERHGLDRRDVAELGADHIVERLRALGFETYDELIMEALPAEVAARADLVAASNSRSWVRGPIGEVIAGAAALDRLLDIQVERLESYRVLATRLLGAAGQVLEMARRLDHAMDVTRTASYQVADSAPVLLNVANVLGQPMRGTVTGPRGACPRSSRLAGACRVAAVPDRSGEPAQRHGRRVRGRSRRGHGSAEFPERGPLLCDALHEGVIDMTATVAEVNQELHVVATLVEAAGERLDGFRRFLGQWRILVMRHAGRGHARRTVAAVDEEITAGHAGIDLLRGLGRECRVAALPIDLAVLEAHVSRIRVASMAA